MTLVATINNIMFFFFTPLSTFLIEGGLRSKNFKVLIEGMIESKSYFAKVYNLRSDLFPDPVGHFGLSGR